MNLGRAAAHTEYGDAFTDRSGTIAQAGVSQQAAAEQRARCSLLIQNPASAPSALFVNFSADAVVNGAGSIGLPAGGYILFDASWVTTEAVNVASVTIGHAYVVKEAIA